MMSKEPGPDGPALVHPSFRLVEAYSSERGVICVITITPLVSVQVSGVRCQREAKLIIGD